MRDKDSPFLFAYQIHPYDRVEYLKRLGFVRDSSKVWRHTDGRGAGESTLLALCDTAFCRFAGITVEFE
jgi:hypothetical protein